MNYVELMHHQIQKFTDSYQLFTAMQDAHERAGHYSGSMYWKTIKELKMFPKALVEASLKEIEEF